AQAVAAAAQFEVVLDAQGRHRAAGVMQAFGAPVGGHGLEGQGVFVGAAKQKGTGARACLGLVEAVVDRIDQRRDGAEVGAQHVVPAGGRTAGLQVAVDVSAAKAIDRLLGVADEQQRGVRVVVGGAVQRLEQAVLQGG